jgi:uncharacterized protein (TIGR03437 family)
VNLFPYKEWWTILIRATRGYRPGRLALLLAAAAAMLTGQIVHPLAQPRYDQGPVEANFRLGYIQMMFQQTATQRASLDQLLVAQRDPASPDYHNWLTPEQYADRFGVSPAELARATAWLKSAGFTIEYTARARDWVAFSGTAAQVQAAFHTSVDRYIVGGETHFAVATEPLIPPDLKPLVATMFGLNDFHPKPMVKPANTSGAGYTLVPGDLATIYDIKPLYQQGLTGTKEKIVIVGQAAGNESLLSDVQQFRDSYGLGQEHVEFFSDGTPPSTDQGDQVEADLDLEWAGAIAPNATLIYVFGTNADNSAFFAIDQDLGPIISESFGICEAQAQVSAPSLYEAEAKKGNALGITWIASSGDSGAAGCDPDATVASNGLAVSLPASIPEVTAVGGTEFNEGSGNYWSSAIGSNGSSALGYIAEMAWNDTAINGSLAATGGGVSNFYQKPSWQIGPGVPADGQRDVPDIALAAANDHDPYNIITSGELALVGGTSVAAPAFAAMLALLNQHLQENGAGNINPALYRFAVSSPAMFHDVVNNNNIVPCDIGTSNCAIGQLGYNAGIRYDLTTGLGSVEAYNLVTGWAGAAVSGAAPVITSVANAASYDAGVVSPGEMVVIFGTGLGPTELAGMALNSSGLVSTQYSSNAVISVQFNGFAAPLVYTSSTAIAVMVPYEITGSTAQVTVTYQGKTSTPAAVDVVASAPGIFTTDASGTGQAVVVNNYETGILNSTTNPAGQGSTIIMYATGAGQTWPEGVDGKLGAAPLPVAILPVSVTIGGVQAVVQYAGGAFGEVAGVLQFIVVVPNSVSGSAVPIVVRIGHAVSQTGVTIAVAETP